MKIIHLSAMKHSAIAAIALGAAGLLASGPVAAKSFSGDFAQYGAVNSAPNLNWTHTGATTGTLATPGVVNVKFSFLNPTLISLQNLPATFTLSAATDEAANEGFGFVIQPDVDGSFSFNSTGAFTVGGHTYAAGTQLLGGTFTGASISGVQGGNTGGSQDSILGGGTVVFTSGILPSLLMFDPAGNEGFSIALNDIRASLDAIAGQSLKDFKSNSVGNYYADLLTGGGGGVPEPASWALMMVGMGGVGYALRRRARGVPTSALS